MSLDPRTPVIVGTAQCNGREFHSEPVATMVEVAGAALADSGASALRSKLAAVHVVKGIWPYADPGRLIADELGLEAVTTGLTRLGGNGVFDLINELAAHIQAGDLDAALVCSAETMRTRRRDKAEGRTSEYLGERPHAVADVTFGDDRDLADAIDFYAGMHEPVNFYAMVETAIRHRRRESPGEHAARIAGLWSDAATIATTNPHAWITDASSAEAIATTGPGNRMVASPYPKLMTSNINVDQAAAIIVCSAAAATAAGVPGERQVPILAGAGAHDHWITRTRWALDESPALRIAGSTALDLAGLAADDVELLDLYSCFPSAVQVAQRELAIDERRPFTVTGGMTFAGGPYNSYCMHSLARSVELVRDGARNALLSGNGGFFTKHSFIAIGSDASPSGFRYARPQSEVDQLAERPVPSTPPSAGLIESYTVTFDKAAAPERAIVSVIAPDEGRTWTVTDAADAIDALLAGDACGRAVVLRSAERPHPPEVMIA